MLKSDPITSDCLHLMTHSPSRTSIQMSRYGLWTPLLLAPNLKKVFICTLLSAGHEKIWLMENAKLLRSWPNPRHCCKKPIQDKGRQLQILMVSLTSWIPNCPFGLHFHRLLAHIGGWLKSSNIKALIFTSFCQSAIPNPTGNSADGSGFRTPLNDFISCF